MATRVESQAGGANDGAPLSIPSAFENDLKLGATEAIMWIACRRRFSPEMIRNHLERRTRNLRRHTGSKEKPRLQVSPALSNRVDKANLLLFRLIIGGVPAIGTLDCEGHPDHNERVPVSVEFLKDGAYIELLSGHIRADLLLEKHSGYQRRTYLHVDIDRDAFFEALAATSSKPALNSWGVTTGTAKQSNRGRKPIWDWDGAVAHLLLVANSPDGLPDLQADIERLVANWFLRTVEKEPTESAIRKHVSVWCKGVLGKASNSPTSN